jgi:class 3 adenylate cyclase/tetratricopeptide (TPR) repeat protein
LTVLFCDLVGSTEIAAQLDPEEWREVVDGYHRAAAEAITRFGGYVAQYLGDGVMAYFGWPEGHDNNAERAVRASLAILEAISNLNLQPERPQLSARIGIHSGWVVVGAGIGRSADIFGHTPNIAARVQAAANPGTALITADTHRLISGLFVVVDCGAQVLRGIERPIPLYQVIRASTARGRIEALTAARGLTPFVGREDELRLLLSRWEHVLDGGVQVVLISGEGGIGKSRLVQHFHRQIAGRPYNWLEGAASPFFQNTPFYAVAGMFRELQAQYHNEPGQISGTSRHQGYRRRARPLGTNGTNGHAANGAFIGKDEQQGQLPSSHQLDVTRELAVAMLGLKLSTHSEPSPPGLLLRERLLATLVEWMIGVTRVAPLAIAIEDLHWADSSTLELLQLVVEQAASAPLMLLCTARPEFRGKWPPRTIETQIKLGPLSAHNARMIVQRVAAGKTLPEATVATVVDRTGGVPLFVEELTRAVLESDNVEHAQDQIPATLHDSLMARLDRLGATRETLQLGAVLGIEFAYELLLAVTPLNEDELQSDLLALTEAELLYPRGVPPNANYQFKHAIIRDAAYEALLKSRRRELHTRIAQTIEERFSEEATSHPEILAYHYTEAGLIAQAIRYWGKAGKVSTARSAYAEAIEHFKHGLELLGTTPSSPERDADELRLQLMLTTPLAATKGYTHSEVEQAANRARDLCDQASESTRLFAVLGGLFSVYYNRGEYVTALGLGRRMLAIAERAGHRRWLLWAHYTLGFNFQAQGDFPSSRFHLERSAALYEPDKSEAYGWVQNPGPTALGMLAHVLCSLGYPDQGLRRAEEAVAMARALHHPYSLAWVLGSIVGVLLRRGDYSKAKEFAKERISLCAQHGFSTGLSEATVHYGFILVQLGHVDEGVAQMRKGLEIDSRTGANQTRLYEQYLAAMALTKIGRLTEALAIVDPLLPMLEQNLENSGIKGDICVLKGDLLLMEGPSGRAEAEENYRRAIELARQNSDRTAELEATIRIARLLDHQQLRDQARLMLKKIYSWFTEGFDTADLKEAKALLDELSP